MLFLDISLRCAAQDCVDTCGSCNDCINTVTSGFVNPIYSQWTGTSLAPLIPQADPGLEPTLVPCACMAASLLRCTCMPLRCTCECVQPSL